jgi:hypothetical protein
LAERGNVLTQKFGVGKAADIVFAKDGRFKHGAMPILIPRRVRVAGQVPEPGAAAFLQQGVAGGFQAGMPLDAIVDSLAARFPLDSNGFRRWSALGAAAGRERALRSGDGDGRLKHPGGNAREAVGRPVTGVHTCGRWRLVVWSV